MKPTRSSLVAVLFLAAAAATLLPPTPRARAQMLAARTLTRTEDRVIVSGPGLKPVVQTEIARLRVYAHHGEKGMVPIPYQIDERREDGEYVYQHGKDTKPDRFPGRLDGNDEVVFMANDCGDRVDRKSWPAGAVNGAEIEVKDPLDGATAWVYLLHFPEGEVPAPSDVDYVSVEIGEDGKTAFTGRNYYADNDQSPESAFRTTNLRARLASGELTDNYVDATQIRVNVNYLFVEVERKTDDVRVTIESWIDGPVRVICNNAIEVYLFLGLWVSSKNSRCFVYGNGSELPTTVSCPVNVDGGDEVSLYKLYLDLGEKASGMKFFNSLNPEPVVIDGKTDGKEKFLDRRYPEFNAVYGEHGGVITRLILHDKVVRDQKLNALVYWDDDAAAPDPPEYFPGRRGCAGFQVDLSGLTKGTYTANYVLHYPTAGFGPGDEKKFLVIHDHPLKVTAREPPAGE